MCQLVLPEKKKTHNHRLTLTLAKGATETNAVLTIGLDSECWGDERTSIGMLRAGLVPEPLLPANWPQDKEKKQRGQSGYLAKDQYWYNQDKSMKEESFRTENNEHQWNHAFNKSKASYVLSVCTHIAVIAHFLHSSLSCKQKQPFIVKET